MNNIAEYINNTAFTISICACFIVGIATGVNFNSFYWFYLIALIPFIAGVFFASKLRILLIIALLAMIFGYSYCLFRAPVISEDDISHLAPCKEVIVTGIVTSEPGSRSEDRLRFEFKADNVIINNKNKPYKGNIIVTILDKKREFDVIKIGYQLKLKGNLYLPKSATNPAQFDYRKYLLYRGITSQMFVLWKDYHILDTPKSLKYSILNYLSLLKSHIQKVHDNVLGKHEAQLLGGIVLGERAIPMDKNIKQEFINSGLVHILAASGLNVALLALAWVFITSRLMLPYNIQIIGGMLIVILYSLLTGLPPSVMRASIMLELVLLGKLINKNANMVAIIFFVASILLLYNPYMIQDIGFQLSFITTFGLIISVPAFQKYIVTIPHWLAMLVLIPFIAQVWAMPIIIYYFHNFSTYSLVANFFAMPLVAIITYMGFASSVISIIPYIGIPIASFIDSLLSPVLSILLFIAHYISNMPFALRHFSAGSTINIICFYLIVMIILYAMYKKFDWKKNIIILFSITLIIIGFNLLKKDPDNLKMIFFDVGDAESILITTPGGKNILLDGGYRKGTNYNASDWLLKPYFYANGISDIDAIILSHPQNDHIGGLPEIIEEFNVHNYYDAGMPSESKQYNYLLSKVAEKNIKYNILRKGDIINITDGVKLSVLNPPEKPENIKDHNKNSLVIKLEYGNKSFLLTGDTERELLNNITDSQYDIDILKVGHHGSKKSLGENYLKLTTPEIAIISAGSEYGHPAKEIMELLIDHNIPAYCTKKSGTITIITDGKNLKVKEYLHSH